MGILVKADRIILKRIFRDDVVLRFVDIVEIWAYNLNRIVDVACLSIKSESFSIDVPETDPSFRPLMKSLSNLGFFDFDCALIKVLGVDEPVQIYP